MQYYTQPICDPLKDDLAKCSELDLSKNYYQNRWGLWIPKNCSCYGLDYMDDNWDSCCTCDQIVTRLKENRMPFSGKYSGQIFDETFVLIKFVFSNIWWKSKIL